MNPKSQKTRSEILNELQTTLEEKHVLDDKLLQNIRQNRNEIERLLATFRELEPDLIYRFYHQSFKVFGLIDLIKRSNELFERLAPESSRLNNWYNSITNIATSKKFDASETNRKWLEETLPITQGFWHAKYFLEQMIVAADALETAPQVLPSGWAAVLYLYNLR